LKGGKNNNRNPLSVARQLLAVAVLDLFGLIVMFSDITIGLTVLGASMGIMALVIYQRNSKYWRKREQA